LAGLAGGLIGAFVMNEFQAIASEVSKKHKESNRQQNPEQPKSEDSEDATTKAADKLFKTVFGRSLTRDEKKTWGPVMHYAFGGAMGAFYGALAEVRPEASAGFGTAFGVALFAIADEAAVPALGLSREPKNYPLSSHVMALGSHVVYGTTTEAVRRIAAYLSSTYSLPSKKLRPRWRLRRVSLDPPWLAKKGSLGWGTQ
jgi:uncharacterized membrane protein YagU involved in acid resistance